MHCSKDSIRQSKTKHSIEKQITKSTFSLTMLNVKVNQIISLDDVRLRCLYAEEIENKTS